MMWFRRLSRLTGPRGGAVSASDPGMQPADTAVRLNNTIVVSETDSGDRLLRLLVDALDPEKARKDTPTLYNGRYTGRPLPEKPWKAPKARGTLPPGSSVIDDTIAQWMKDQGITP